MKTQIKRMLSGMELSIPLFFCSLAWCQGGVAETRSAIVDANDCVRLASELTTPKKKRSKKKTKVKTKTVEEREREAALCAMPLPVGGVLQSTAAIEKDVLHKGQSLTYLVEDSRQELTAFYERGMMQLGWHTIAQVQGAEDLLVYETPTKIALVVIRPQKPKKGWKSPKILVSLHEASKKQEAELV